MNNIVLNAFILTQETVYKQKQLLQIHHINPIFLNGKDEIANLITLCLDCHYFTPNKKEDFEEYLKEECTRTMTILIKSINKVRNEHTVLFI